MKLQVVKTLYFYEVPTLILCQDKSENNFLFVLLDEEQLEYIGKKSSAEDASQFLLGELDLRGFMEGSTTNYYTGSFSGPEEFTATLYKGLISEEMLPESGLTLIPADEQMAAAIRAAVIRRLHSGSTTSEVGQIERKTQNRVVALFQKELGYRYLGNWQDRDANSNVEVAILKQWLVEKKGTAPSLADKAIEKLLRVTASTGRKLYDVNKDVYDMLRYGISVSPEPGKVAERIFLIDWKTANENDFAIAEEVTVDSRQYKKRPDIVLYVNGIAVGVLELKRSTVSVSEGIRQCYGNQQHMFIKPFFHTIQYVMAGNDIEGISYGTIKTTEKYYLKWKELSAETGKDFPWLLAANEEIRARTAKYDYPLDKNIIELLSKERLIEGMRDFVIYDRGQKKLCRANQYFGVKGAQDFVKRREDGIIWHTQGSGKSLTMVWLSKWIYRFNPNARVLIVTDREELDEQIEKVYTGVDENIYRTTSGGDLLARLNDTTPWLMCSLIHKFGGKDKAEADEEDIEHYIADLKRSIPANYKAKGDIYVFVDECHRTQSGKLHQAMKHFIPGAVFYGFTGTPLLANDKQNSQQLFGRYIHTYKFNEAVADKVVLDLRYEARDVEQKISSPDKIDEWFDLKTRGLTDFAKAELKVRWGTMKKVFSSRSRLEKIVLDIMVDIEKKERLQNGRGNAILVSDSILNACRYYQLFQNAGLKECAIVTSYAPNYRDLKTELTGEGKTEAELRYKIYSEMLADYFKVPVDTAVNMVEQFETEVKDRFINHPAQMKLLIVVNKLLTGYDAPSATYLYIDKTLRDHGLFQAVCRVNRLDGEDKDYGYIIDYKDLFKSLEAAYHVYTNEAFSGYQKEDIDGLLKDRLQKGKERLAEALEAIKALCEPVEEPQGDLQFIHYFCGNTENPDELKDTEPRRVMLYKLTIGLLRAYANIADEMLDAGYTVQEIEAIKADIRHFEAVRKVVQIASRDHIDLKRYEPAMRHLIDSYIGAEDSKVLANMGDLSLVELLMERGKDALNDLPEGLRDNPEAMAEAIENNVRKVIIEESLKNPLYYEKMSVLLDELIKRRKESTIKYAQYLDEIIALSGRVKKPAVAEYPLSLNSAGQRNLYDNTGKNEQLAIDLNKAVTDAAKDDWRGNKMKTNRIRNAIKGVLESHGITGDEELQNVLTLVEKQSEY